MRIRWACGQPLCVLLSLVLLLGAASPVAATSDPFPVYDCIKPNVAFWTEIYAKYPTTQGVLHDSQDLNIVYEVIEVERDTGTAARERNSAKTKAVKARYEEMLQRLAQGNPPANAEERRVLALFGQQVDSERLLKASGRIRFQLGQQDNFREGLIRSGRYLDQIKEIIRGHGLPEDLAYLPHVESSFNYKAYSKFGAAGIWQFTHETGKRFMTIDYAVDERRDPIRATHAAARLLKENHARLGDWALALTAYNHGANGMQRAKNEKGDYEAIFKEYESGLFKFASRNFYSEFLAAREVAKNYQRHFGEISLAAPVRSHEVALKGHMPLHDLLSHFKVDKETFQQFNPALREPVYLGQKYVPKGYQVRLPAGKEATQLASCLPDEGFRSQQKRSSVHMVRRGDTAGSIARRYAVSVKELMAANKLNGRAAIYVGQNLRIPRGDEPVAQLAATAKKRQVADTRLASLTPQVPPPDYPEEAAGEKIKPVAKGATKVKPGSPPKDEQRSEPALHERPRLAAAHDVEPPAEKALANGKEPLPQNVILSGMHGTVEAAPLVALASPEVLVGQFGVLQIFVEQGRNYGIIRVEAEETLGHYAEWLGGRAQELRQLNNMHLGQEIKIDQTLKIPLDVVAKERFEEMRYEYHKEMEEDFFGAFQVENVRRYRIKAGDNIWRLCQVEFELPLWLVKKYNTELDVNNLKLGLEIVVPVVVERKS